MAGGDDSWLRRSGSSGKTREKASDIVPIRRSEFLDEVDRMFSQLRREFESSLWPVRVGCPWCAFPPLELRPTREICTDLIDAGSEYRVYVVKVSWALRQRL
jgi:hypothetical protein